MLSHFPLSKIHWGEAVAYLTMFIVGTVVFAVQLTTWALPQLTLYQEFVPSRGTVLETRITEKHVSHGSGTDSNRNAVRYRPEILLEHRSGNRGYHTWTFDYPTLTETGNRGYFDDRRSAETALEKFTPEQHITCWYRSGHPEQVIAVWNVSILGWCLLSVSFVLIILGLAGFFQSFRYLAVSRERQSVLTQPADSNTELWNTVPDVQTINDSPGTRLSYRLPFDSRPMMPIFGLLAFAIAWNIIAVGILIHLLIVPTDTLTDQVIGIAFRALFCTIGILLFWGVIRRLWNELRIASMLLEISDHPIYPGRKYRVLLYQNNFYRFQLLQVDLVCEEIARFHQGTDTATSRKTVFRKMLFSLSDFTISPEMPLDKEFSLQLPHGAMHSFCCNSNEITWRLELTIHLQGKEPLRRDCCVIVRPANVFDGLG
jgi:hypothetical protein